MNIEYDYDPKKILNVENGNEALKPRRTLFINSFHNLKLQKEK